MKTHTAILAGAVLALACTAFAQTSPVPTQTFSFNASPISDIGGSRLVKSAIKISPQLTFGVPRAEVITIPYILNPRKARRAVGSDP